ncbi:hypothetical protein TNCV_1721801 [Trichonephila clavipes]|nr:hypothetical protein TNCV_1721801 [Trichonephila clavipes]
MALALSSPRQPTPSKWGAFVIPARAKGPFGDKSLAALPLSVVKEAEMAVLCVCVYLEGWCCSYLEMYGLAAIITITHVFVYPRLRRVNSPGRIPFLLFRLIRDVPSTFAHMVMQKAFLSRDRIRTEVNGTSMTRDVLRLVEALGSYTNVGPGYDP